MPPAPTPPYPLTAVVIDGATGSGRIVSSRLAAAGAVIAVVAAAGSRTAAYLSKELTEIGLTALPYQVDPFDPQSARDLVSDVVHDLGPIDLLIDLVPAQPDKPAPVCVSRAVRESMAASDRTGRILLLPGTAAALAGGGSPKVVVDTVHAPEAPGAGPTAADQRLADSVLLLLGLSRGGSTPGDSPARR